MARIDVPDGSGLERERLLMMQLDVAMGMGAYSAAIYEKTSLPPRVREVARLRIAAANGCPVCLNTRSAHATEDGFDEATVEAVVACDLGGVHTSAISTNANGSPANSPTASRRIITDSTTRSWRISAITSPTSR